MIVAATNWSLQLNVESGDRSFWRRSIGTFVPLVALLIVLAVLLKSRQYADADAWLIRNLAETRSSGLVSVFTIVTTMGDVVPSLLIALGIGTWFYLTSRRTAVVLILPLLILIELIVQFGVSALSNDVTLSGLNSSLSIGAAGPLPSGSVARLFSVFVISSFLWPRTSRVGRGLPAVGAIAVLIELTSRLYLGRHFVTDIAGGLVLGVLLVIIGIWSLRAIRYDAAGMTDVCVMDRPVG